MRSKKLVVAVSVVAGIGIGLAVGPVLNIGSAVAASSPTRTYRCLGSPEQGGNASGWVRLHNLTTKTISVSEVTRGATGIPGAPVPFTMVAKSTTYRNLPNGVFILEYRTKGKLLLDATFFAVPAIPNDNSAATSWQQRCT